MKEVKHILSMIDGIKGKDGRNYYSNEVFKTVQKLLEEHERRRREELKMKEEMYTEEVFRTEYRTQIVNNNIQGALFTTLVSAVLSGIIAAGGQLMLGGVGTVLSYVGGWFGF